MRTTRSSLIARANSGASSSQGGRRNSLSVRTNIANSLASPPAPLGGAHDSRIARETNVKGDGVARLPRQSERSESMTVEAIPGGCPHQRVIRLFGSVCHHVHGHVFAALLAVVKSHAAGRERKESVVFAHADVAARI